MQKQRLPLWALAWLAVVLAALVLFLANQGAVDRLLAATGLEKVLYPNGKNAVALSVQTPAVPTPSVLVDPPPAGAQLTNTPLAGSGEPSPDPAAAAPAAAAPVDETPSAEAPLPATPNTFRLYFLKLSPEGRLEPASFARELPAGATPLAATLKALLLGPTLQDKAQGALTEVPDGTKLLSVRLKDRTALVSLSEEFSRNASGTEGLAGQLRQIVWTATQFASVDAVQILINGQYRDSLGDGALPIATPFTRANVP